MKEKRETLFTVIEVTGADGQTYMEVDWRPGMYLVLDEISPNAEITDKIIDIAEEIVEAMNELAE